MLCVILYNQKVSYRPMLENISTDTINQPIHEHAAWMTVLSTTRKIAASTGQFWNYSDYVTVICTCSKNLHCCQSVKPFVTINSIVKNQPITPHFFRKNYLFNSSLQIKYYFLSFFLQKRFDQTKECFNHWSHEVKWVDSYFAVWVRPLSCKLKHILHSNYLEPTSREHVST